MNSYTEDSEVAQSESLFTKNDSYHFVENSCDERTAQLSYYTRYKFLMNRASQLFIHSVVQGENINSRRRFSRKSSLEI